MRCKELFEELFVFFCLFGPFAGCSQPSELSRSESRTAESVPYDRIEEGDLVFRRGRSVVSTVVASIGADGRHPVSSFTHVGIICIIAGDTLIVHAVPGENDSGDDFDRVRASKPEEFCSEFRASSVGFFHIDSSYAFDSGKVRRYAVRCLRDSVRFDSGYDLYDSTRLYCTEFVRNAYICAGLDIAQGCIRNLPLLGRDVLLPSDLTESPCLKNYYSIVNK